MHALPGHSSSKHSSCPAERSCHHQLPHHLASFLSSASSPKHCPLEHLASSLPSALVTLRGRQGSAKQAQHVEMSRLANAAAAHIPRLSATHTPSEMPFCQAPRHPGTQAPAQPPSHPATHLKVPSSTT